MLQICRSTSSPTPSLPPSSYATSPKTPFPLPYNNEHSIPDEDEEEENLKLLQLYLLEMLVVCLFPNILSQNACRLLIFQKHLTFLFDNHKERHFSLQNKCRFVFWKHISTAVKEHLFFGVPNTYAGFDLGTQDRSSFRTYYTAPLPEGLILSIGASIAWESERLLSSTRPASNLRHLSTIASTLFSNSSLVLASM